MVEDDPDILLLVLRHLRANGFLPNGFSDPIQALQEFNNDRDRYSIVITDIRMPQMSGLQLARELLKINPQTHVIVMTALALEKDELEGLPAITLEDVIRKPFKLAEICNKIKQFADAT